MTAYRPAVRCRATNRAGEPCRNYAMHGSHVCHAHGGRAPQVRTAARRRLDYADAYRGLARHMAERQAQYDAIAPWADEIRYLQLDHALRLPPHLLARRARMMAAEMRRKAKAMHAYAREIMDTIEEEDDSCPGG